MCVVKCSNCQEFVPAWGVPTGSVWTLLGQFVELFYPTAEAITMLEGEKYVTQSLILLQLCTLEKCNSKIKAKCMLVIFFGMQLDIFRSERF